jgi:general secretion pathway protein L
MDTCFLFTEYLNDAGCLCLKLSADGMLKAPPTQRIFSEIKALQEEAKTILVESCANATLINLELPWLPERKARAAIPYALEDDVAQPVEELHFAFDRLRYQTNHYQVTVIAKQRMHELIQQMDDHAIAFDLITLDWFALDEQQLCISDNHLLINQPDFKGTLSGSLALSYLTNHPENPPLIFQNNLLISGTDLKPNANFSYTWVAQKLLTSKPLNLCQGAIQHGNTSDWIKKGYKLTALACGIWLVSIILVNAMSLHSLNKKNSALDQQIEVIYHQFFPDAKQVISPKFRISQLLSANQTENQARFWFLINEFAKIMQGSSINIQQLRYQNKILSVTVISPDFDTLEHLENNLKKASLKVNQTEASTHDQQVMATLELT